MGDGTPSSHFFPNLPFVSFSYFRSSLRRASAGEEGKGGEKARGGKGGGKAREGRKGGEKAREGKCT